MPVICVRVRDLRLPAILSTRPNAFVLFLDPLVIKILNARLGTPPPGYNRRIEAVQEP
jgi:hypothetical protein